MGMRNAFKELLTLFKDAEFNKQSCKDAAELLKSTRSFP